MSALFGYLTPPQPEQACVIGLETTQEKIDKLDQDQDGFGIDKLITKTKLDKGTYNIKCIRADLI